MKRLMMLIVLLVAGGMAKGDLLELKFYLFEQWLGEKVKILPAEKKVEDAQKALAAYKSTAPTIWYVTAGGVKREAVDGKLVDLAKALENAQFQLTMVQKKMVAHLADIDLIFALTDKTRPVFWKQMEKQYLDRQKMAEKKQAEQVEAWKKDGKTEPEIAALVERQQAAEVIVKAKKEKLIIEELKRAKERRTKAEQVKQQNRQPRRR